MRVETTGCIFEGRYAVQTAFCRAREFGALTAVSTSQGEQVNVCGACLEEMSDTRQWEIPGTRPTPRETAMRIEVTDHIFDGRCEVQTEACYARDSGAVGIVRTPDGEVTVCGACLQHMSESRAWHIPGTRPQPRLRRFVETRSIW